MSPTAELMDHEHGRAMSPELGEGPEGEDTAGGGAEGTPQVHGKDKGRKKGKCPPNSSELVISG